MTNDTTEVSRADWDALVKENERLRLCAAPGRRTEQEYEKMGRPDGWTWLPHVRMYARLDQDHWDALRSTNFQSRVDPWLMACFGKTIAGDRQERNHRFLEEALELVQACGCSAHEAHQLVYYVFGRPVGEKHQEVGGVMVTLAALCLAQGLNMHEAGETELARIWTKVEQIRAKQAAKPKHSPLPA